jgi:hypothetical protein
MKGRTILAFVVTPLAPGLVFTIGGMLVAGPFFIGMGLYMLCIDALVAYPAAILAGLPLYWLTRRLGWVGFGFYLCAGLAVGGAVGALPGLGQFYDTILGEYSTLPEGVIWELRRAALPDFLLIAPGAGCGALVTACFWLIARPDRVAFAADGRAPISGSRASR